MVWEDLLFAHWPVPPDLLQRHLPRGLELDLYAGQAWLGVVPFRMRGVRPRCLPPLPGLSAFPELNVRTYVRGPDRRAGIWFFSLDADQRLAVAAARLVFGLRYLRARMDCREQGEWIEYASERRHAGAPPARLRGRYRPRGPLLTAKDEQVVWLTERYAMYSARPLGAASPAAIYRGDIHHLPWPLQPAEAEFATLDVTADLGVPLLGQPLLHFARRLAVVAWLPRRVA